MRSRSQSLTGADKEVYLVGLLKNWVDGGNLTAKMMRYIYGSAASLALWLCFFEPYVYTLSCLFGSCFFIGIDRR